MAWSEATLAAISSDLSIPEKGAVVAAPVASTSLVALLGGPARRLVVGTVSGTLILTQLDGTTLTLSENVINKRNGVVDHVCTHLQSAACTDILAQR